VSSRQPGRLVKAAIKTNDGVVHVGYRHHDILRQIAEQLADIDRLDDRRRHDHKWGQGFVNEHGTYYPRHQAQVIALLNGQITESVQPLTSEDLWQADGAPLVGI